MICTIHAFGLHHFIEIKAYWEIFLERNRFDTQLLISRTCRDHVRNAFNVLFLLNHNFFLLITSCFALGLTLFLRSAPRTVFPCGQRREHWSNEKRERSGEILHIFTLWLATCHENTPEALSAHGRWEDGGWRREGKEKWEGWLIFWQHNTVRLNAAMKLHQIPNVLPLASKSRETALSSRQPQRTSSTHIDVCR